MREANWSPSPADERNRAAIRRRNAREDALLVLAAGAAASGGIVATIFILVRPWGPFSLFFVFCLLTCMGTVASLLRRNRKLLREMDHHERGLVQEFGGEDGWLVDLMILQGSTPTGQDRGMLWLEDGRLLFSGYRTSFALSPNDAVGKCVRTLAAKNLRHPLDLPLKARTAAGRVTLSLKLDPLQAHAARRDLKAWANLPSAEKGQLPPLVAGPGAPGPFELLFRAVATTVYWLLFLTLMLAAPSMFGIAVPPRFAIFPLFFGFLLGLALGCTHPVGRWRAWWDRRHVEEAR